jgi:phage tail sheath gpL-like
VLFAGTATANGTLALYIGGALLPVGVSSGDTATVIAANVAAAVNAAANLACTATAATATVTLTARHKGLAQNDIDVRLNYRALRGGEVTPSGITATITAMSGGTLNPVLTAAFANLGTQPFDFIALPYTDAASLASATTLLSDQTGRWAATAMLYGHVFAAYRGTVSGRGTFGTGLNSQHMTILGYYNSPTPAWLEAADWAGAHAAIIRTNPALGVVNQPLALLAPPVGDVDAPGDRNVMLHDGISTFRVDATGQCVIDRSITTYQLNPSGAPDDAYLNTNLLFQAAYAVRYIRSQITSQFVNKILVPDGAAIGPGSPATTPSLVFQVAVAIYAYLASQFVVQNVDTFARNGFARSGSKGQVQLYLPIDFSDQVIQVAALIQFRQST